MAQLGFKTDRGKKRENNEDSFFVMPAQNIYMVADGVGGHNAGELASMTAVECIAQYVIRHVESELENLETFERYFLQCLREANQKIFHLAKTDRENMGMATTVVILYLGEKKANFLNLGDSRIYLVRKGEISQLTEDHTYVNELLKGGTITKEEAEDHPQKNMITRALGGEARVQPDFYQVETEKQDVFILCSDGLYGEVSAGQICQVASAAKSMSDLSVDLVKMANANGGNDNITVVCLKI